MDVSQVLASGARDIDTIEENATIRRCYRRWRGRVGLRWCIAGKRHCMGAERDRDQPKFYCSIRKQLHHNDSSPRPPLEFFCLVVYYITSGLIKIHRERKPTNPSGEIVMILQSIKQTRTALLAISLATLGLFSCAPTMQGEYSDPQKVKILDDKWNETDAHSLMRVMITSSLGRPWLKNYKAANNGKAPLVVVQDIENRTDEHIDTVSLTQFMETELVNSGKVRFVEKARREQINEELQFQNSGMVNANTKKKTGNFAGADFMLAGSIASQVHTNGGTKRTSYFVQMKLINIETSEIQWTEKHEISKEFRRSSGDW